MIIHFFYLFLLSNTCTISFFFQWSCFLFSVVTLVQRVCLRKLHKTSIICSLLTSVFCKQISDSHCCDDDLTASNRAGKKSCEITRGTHEKFAGKETIGSRYTREKRTSRGKFVARSIYRKITWCQKCNAAAVHRSRISAFLVQPRILPSCLQKCVTRAAWM